MSSTAIATPHLIFFASPAAEDLGECWDIVSPSDSLRTFQPPDRGDFILHEVREKGQEGILIKRVEKRAEQCTSWGPSSVESALAARTGASQPQGGGESVAIREPRAKREGVRVLPLAEGAACLVAPSHWARPRQSWRPLSELGASKRPVLLLHHVPISGHLGDNRAAQSKRLSA